MEVRVDRRVSVGVGVFVALSLWIDLTRSAQPSAFFHEAVVEILDLDVDLRPEWAREHRGGGKCSPGVVEKGLVGEKGLYAGANHSS